MGAADTLTVDARTKAQQAMAVNPEKSVWVSANAGSGKTYVLTRRVIRLLLEGAEPSKILCLTFTKVAAAQMADKVIAELGKWALMPDEDLNSALLELEGTKPTAGRRDAARRLFARALETPGGLNIQTIHAFCEKLLRRFPLEANVPGHFTVMEDAQKKELMAQARRDVTRAILREPESPLAAAWHGILGAASDHAIDKAFETIQGDRAAFSNWLDRHGDEVTLAAGLCHRLDMPVGTTADSVLEDFKRYLNAQAEMIRTYVRHANETGAKRPIKFSRHLQQALEAQDPLAVFNHARNGLLTNKDIVGSQKSTLPDTITDVWPEGAPWLLDLCSTAAETAQRWRTCLAIAHTVQLATFARAVLARFDREKRRRGLLDYSDQIERAADLLTRQDARAWVLYKLDMGIDHVLVDEAQDTSPRQWDVIGALVDEFFSGASARPADRTVFVVGDEKQSIYSFQGARPDRFDGERRSISAKADGAGKRLEESKLTLSFRSTSDVLTLVDQVFAVPGQADGLSEAGDAVVHAPARRAAAGSVALWPLVRPEEEDDPENWQTSIDQTRHQALILADLLAGQIETWVRTKRFMPGDIVVLVRKRDRFIPALNRALKERGVPVGGADRLKLNDHIAILDLIALGRVLALPQDDLSMASVFKSPLLGLSEEDLFHLARARMNGPGRESLYTCLMGSTEPAHSEAQQRMRQWQRWSNSKPVYELYALVLSASGMRQALHNRFGYEVDEVLDEFLNFALTFETAGQPGLTAFLEHLEDNAPEIKRETEAVSQDVRIMTVHAAKGLEAPAVILVDPCSPPYDPRKAPVLRKLDGGHPAGPDYVWIPSKDRDDIDATRLAEKGEKERAEQEYRRLLYVGMTRAADHLLVCGYKGKRGGAEPTWHTMVERGFERAEDHHNGPSAGLVTAEPFPLTGPEGEDQAVKVWTHEGHDTRTPRQPPGQTTTDSPNDALPPWLGRQVDVLEKRPEPLTASTALGDSDERRHAPVPNSPPDRDTSSGGGLPPRQRGLALHTLLELLPGIATGARGEEKRSQQREKAAAFLAQTFPGILDDERRQMLAHVFNVLDDPRLAPCFNPSTSRAEVPLAGSLIIKGETRPIMGIVDRLAVLPDQVIVLDYKTGASVPQDIANIPRAYVGQMALYAEVLKTVFPKKAIATWLVWTGADEPKLFDLPASLLARALAAIQKGTAL
ncbi:MAG: double-strand break repair helicase AddA [Pseudomonadota bacterium]